MRVVRDVHGADRLEPAAGEPLHAAVRRDPQPRERVPVPRKQLLRAAMFRKELVGSPV